MRHTQLALGHVCRSFTCSQLQVSYSEHKSFLNGEKKIPLLKITWLPGMVAHVFNPGTWEAEAGLVNLCSQGYIERPFLENYKANQKNCLFFLFIPFELKPLGELGPSDYRVMSWFCLPYVPGDPPVSASWLTVAACHTHRIALVILGSNSGHQVSMASACFYILRYLLSSGSCFQFFHCGIKYT